MMVRIATVECDGGYWAAAVRHPYSVWPGSAARPTPHGPGGGRPWPNLTARGATEAEAVRGLHDIWRYYVRRV